MIGQPHGISRGAVFECVYADRERNMRKYGI